MKIVLDTVRWLGHKRVFSTIGLEKMSEPEQARARAVDWAAIRVAYETSKIPVHMIGAQHGVSADAIDQRRRRQSWPMRRDPNRIRTTEGARVAAGSVAWEAVRLDYESGKELVLEVCAKHGIGRSRLYDRLNMEHWQTRRIGFPKAYGVGGIVHPAEQLKVILVRKLAALQSRLGFAEKIDPADPLNGLLTLATALQKMLDIEHREKRRDEADRIGGLAINDATRLELARRLEALAETWENE